MEIREVAVTAHGLIDQALTDLRSMNGPKPPYWRFVVHPSIFEELAVAAIHGRDQLMYAAATEVPGRANQVVYFAGAELRLFGLLVTEDPMVDPTTIELRYAVNHPLPGARVPSALPIEPHDGYPSHP